MIGSEPYLLRKIFEIYYTLSMRIDLEELRSNTVI